MSKHLAVVLAAGKGTRMKSELPKVLVPVGGRPMIDFVLDALRAGGIGPIVVVVGYRAELVEAHLADRSEITFVEQTEQLGTGHAVMVCRDVLSKVEGAVAIVAGDSPLAQPESIRSLLDAYGADHPACILGTTHKHDPTGLGRIVRDAAGEFEAIVEHKDATPEQREITEVNMSTYVFNCGELLRALDEIEPNNVQGEYYITDCPGILKRQGKDVRALPVLKACEALSINTVEQLSEVEAELRRQGLIS